MDAKDVISMLTDSGWEWDGRFLRHPYVSEFAVWRHPWKYGLMISPAMLEYIRENYDWLYPLITFIDEASSKKMLH